jgi:hypothetical protein
MVISANWIDVQRCMLIYESLLQTIWLKKNHRTKNQKFTKVREMQNSSKFYFLFFYIWLDRARRAEQEYMCFNIFFKGFWWKKFNFSRYPRKVQFFEKTTFFQVFVILENFFSLLEFLKWHIQIRREKLRRFNLFLTYFSHSLVKICL